MEMTSVVRARFRGVAALVAVVALAGITSSVATAAKPVPTITPVSCTSHPVFTPNGPGYFTRVTIGWTGAGKVADPTSILVGLTSFPSGSSVPDFRTYDTAEFGPRQFTKAELRSNTVTFDTDLFQPEFGFVPPSIDLVAWQDAAHDFVVGSNEHVDCTVAPF